MEALVDGDTVAFRCAVSAENEPEEIALLRTDKMLRDILSFSDTYKMYLTGKNNFRYKINPEYKANRKDKPKPQWLEICRLYLEQEYKAEVTDGYEADDALGINQTEESVIFSNDKDLLMIPGHHYNFITGKYFEVSELDGLKQFYRQMLIGDSADNIKGVDKIGKVKAAKLIDSIQTEREMFLLVQNLYLSQDIFVGEARFKMNADCLWIMRKEGETYSKRLSSM